MYIDNFLSESISKHKKKTFWMKLGAPASLCKFYELLLVEQMLCSRSKSWFRELNSLQKKYWEKRTVYSS